MKVCSLGRAARAKAGIKVRQPLETVYVGVASEREERALESVAPLVLDELNVKEMRYDSVENVAGLGMSGFAVASEPPNSVAVSTYISLELEAEGMAREIVHRLQTMRRSAGYEIADHIIAYYDGDASFVQVVSAFADYIRQETLAVDIQEEIPEDADLKETHRINSYPLTLGVKKAEVVLRIQYPTPSRSNYYRTRN